MTRPRRVLLWGLVVVLLGGASTLVAVRTVAGGELEGVTVTFSASVAQEEVRALQELLDRFQHQTRARINFNRLAHYREPLGAKVNLVTNVPSSELVKRLKKESQGSRTSIDLFAQDNVALRQLVEEGLVQGVEDVPVEHEAVPMVPDQYSHFFLPFRPNVRLTYARKVDFDRAGIQLPDTEDELKDAARSLKGAGAPKVTLSLAQGDPAAVTVSELIVSHGGDPLVLNDTGSIEAFTFLQDLWREGLLARESLFAKYDSEVANLRDGVSSLAQNWSFTSAVLARAGRLKDFAVYAGWTGPRGAAHVIGGDVLGIPKGVRGKQRKAAVALARFLMSKDSQALLAQRNVWPSYRNDIDESRSGIPREQRETFAAIRGALKDGWLRPTEGWKKATELMNEAVDRIVVRGESVRPVLDELHAEMR